MQLKASLFKQYEFTQKEYEEALAFNHLQVGYLETLLSNAMLEKIALTFDPNDVHKYVQEEAELQGKISILLELLQQTSELQSSKES